MAKQTPETQATTLATQTPDPSQALATTAPPGLNLPVLANQEEFMEAFRANMEGVDNFQFERVKIPSGGGITFEIMDENGEPDSVKELVGIIVDHYPVNAYWANEYSGQGVPPDCASLDGKRGAGDPGGSCAVCRLNQWGSDPKSGRGKACKNITRVYILAEGNALPILVPLPPTSKGNFGEYMGLLAKKMRPYYGVITRVKLQKTQNKDGISYSEVALTRVDDLTPQQRADIKKFAEVLKPAMRAVGLDAADYNTVPVDDGGGGGAGRYQDDVSAGSPGGEPGGQSGMW